MRTKLPTRQKLDAKLLLLVPTELKQSLFEAAANSGRTAAEVAREGLRMAIRKAA